MKRFKWGEWWSVLYHSRCYTICSVCIVRFPFKSLTFSLIDNASFNDKYICYTIQYMIPFCFFPSEKEGIEKENTIQVYFQLTLLHLLAKRVPKSSWFWSHFPSIMVNCPRQLHPTCPSKLPKLPQSHQKTQKSLNRYFSDSSELSESDNHEFC